MLGDRDFLNNVLNEVDSYIFIIDEFKRIVEASNNTFNLLEYKYHDLLEKPFSFLVLSEDKDRVEKILKDMFDGNTFDNQEFFIQTKQGVTKLISFKHFMYRRKTAPSPDDPAYTFYDEEYIVLIGKDITNERMLEQSEKIEQAKFDSLFHNPGVAQAIIDMDMRFIEVNETFCSLLGYKRSDMLNLTPKDITYIKDVDSIEYICNKLLKDGHEYVQVEKRYKKYNGFFFWALVTTTLQKTKDGQPLYFIQTIQDITEKRFLQEQAQENERKYKLLFHRSFNAIAYKKLIFDKKGRAVDYIILDANESFEKLTGLKRNEIINRPMKAKAQEHFRVTTNENMKRLKHYDQIIKDGKDVHYTRQKSRKTGEEMDVYYYILDKQEAIFATVFGDTNGNTVIP